jgi:hypothetical protein
MNIHMKHVVVDVDTIIVMSMNIITMKGAAADMIITIMSIRTLM